MGSVTWIKHLKFRKESFLMRQHFSIYFGYYDSEKDIMFYK